MKLLKNTLLVSFLVVTTLLIVTPNFYSNLWSVLISKAFIIPNQSTIFTFKVIKMNNGNGDYWLYGEDKKYYYTTLERGNLEPYALISKTQASRTKGFNKTNYKTWFGAYLNDEFCGDLLEIYVQKPRGLEFIDCEISSKPQTLVRAEYRVAGSNVQQVENFLVEKYGMGELKWVCCGWGNGGQYGQFEHAALKQINPYCSGIICMFSEGISEQEEYFKKIEIDYFTVIVELVIV